MRYVVLLVDYVDRRWEDLSEEEQGAWMVQHGAFDDAVASHPGTEMVAAEALTGGDSATVYRRGSGTSPPTLVDGPYAEATEGIGGLYVIDAPDLDVLVGLLAVLPPYVIEIRPVDSL